MIPSTSKGRTSHSKDVDANDLQSTRHEHGESRMQQCISHADIGRWCLRVVLHSKAVDGGLPKVIALKSFQHSRSGVTTGDVNTHTATAAHPNQELVQCGILVEGVRDGSQPTVSNAVVTQI